MTWLVLLWTENEVSVLLHFKGENSQEKGAEARKWGRGLSDTVKAQPYTTQTRKAEWSHGGTQGHWSAKIICHMHSNMVCLMSSREVKAMGHGLVQFSEVQSQAWRKELEHQCSSCWGGQDLTVRTFSHSSFYTALIQYRTSSLL